MSDIWEEHERELARKANGGFAPHMEKLPWISMADWDHTPMPIRHWAVFNRIPARQTTLFTGEGAVGKSINELQLCVAHVLGRDWLGSMPEMGPAIYFGAEDEADEIRRRLTDIARYYGATFSDLIKGGLHLLSFAGEDATLAVSTRNGPLEATNLYRLLLEAAGDIKPRHIGIDTSADVYGGDECNRAQVKRFVGMLTKIAMISDGSVVLLAHPSLAGISSGTGLSGSTGWHNSVRGRMYQKGVDGEPMLRELQFMKNNYGPPVENILLRWKDGLFLPVPATGDVEQAIAEGKVDRLFLDLLRKLFKQGRNATNKNGTSFAPTLFAAEPEAVSAKIGAKDFLLSMARLLHTAIIMVETYGPPSRERSRLCPISGWEVS